MSTPAGWDGILDEDETILWQGRPDGRVILHPGGIAGVVFGLGFAGFAMVWMLLASTNGGIFWMFGLLHFSVGIALAVGAVFWAPYCRRHTWYTLTDKRAFIATDLLFRDKSLKYYPIHPHSKIELIKGALSTIFFASTSRRTSKGRTSVTRIGFERIPDGPTVYRLIRDIQRNADDESETP